MSLELSKHAAGVDVDEMKAPAGYVVEDPDLVAAANAAIALGKPLLLTGEPGIGKSEFARWLAAQTPACDLLEFVVKSTTDAGDLFYQFDALARFRDAQLQSLKQAQAPLPGGAPKTDRERRHELHKYLRYNALGMAILRSQGREKAEQADFISPTLGDTYRDFPVEPARSVVLIDEIDKAPRDVPNDILDEILHRRFRVTELDGIEARADQAHSPIVVITSNSERDLPKPFLRRCIYYHMRLSKDPAALHRIAERRMGSRFLGNETLLGDCIQLFLHLRGSVRLAHQPGLAELLDWLAELARRAPTPGARLASLDHGRSSLKTALLKEARDQQRADEEWPAWLKDSSV